LLANGRSPCGEAGDDPFAVVAISQIRDSRFIDQGFVIRDWGFASRTKKEATSKGLVADARRRVKP